MGTPVIFSTVGEKNLGLVIGKKFYLLEKSLLLKKKLKRTKAPHYGGAVLGGMFPACCGLLLMSILFLQMFQEYRQRKFIRRLLLQKTIGLRKDRKDDSVMK